MCRIFAFAFLVLLASCATQKATFGLQPEALVTPSYALTIHLNCQEGVVGCDVLAAELETRSGGKSVRLTGDTYMVKCADGVTPCHLGYYKLVGAGFLVIAYPDGKLEITPPEGSEITEQGGWLTY